jgi:hypothetical protein
MTLEEKINILINLRKEFTDVYTKLYNEPYPSLSGMYMGLYEIEILGKNDESFMSNIDLMNKMLKDVHMQYYKKVSSGVFAE